MRFKKSKDSNNDAIMLLRYSLMALLLILLPLTLFLTAYSWYTSLQVHALNSTDLVGSLLFVKNALIFGTIGLVGCLPFFLLFVLMNISLKRVSYNWKKIILVVSIITATIIFLVFEIFSIVFINYFYSWQLSLVLTFWPLLYVILAVIILVDYFNFYNQQKAFILNKKQQEEDREAQFRNQIDTIF